MQPCLLRPLVRRRGGTLTRKERGSDPEGRGPFRRVTESSEHGKGMHTRLWESHKDVCRQGEAVEAEGAKEQQG